MSAAPAYALYGPETQDPNHPIFELNFEETSTPVTQYDALHFDSRHGWDFEDRDGYECANVATYDANDNLEMLVEFEQSKDYLSAASGSTFRINDHWGQENEGPYANYPPRDCGNELHNDPNNSRWAPSGEDHFPHYNMMMAEMNGDPVTIYRDGVVDATLTADLTAELVNTDCDRGYWTPGDEPGELVLWWDADFPEHAMEGGDPLNCGGGGNEPVPVARMFFPFLASNMGVCISDMDAPGGQTCSGMTEPPGPFFATPDEDVAVGPFTPTPLHSSLADHDDLTAVSSPQSTSTQSFTVGLSDVPAGSATLRVSMKRVGANATTVMVTSEGTSCQFPPTTSFAVYTCLVSTDGVATVQVSRSGGKTGLSVGWIELEVA